MQVNSLPYDLASGCAGPRRVLCRQTFHAETESPALTARVADQVEPVLLGGHRGHDRLDRAVGIEFIAGMKVGHAVFKKVRLASWIH
ncbi:MAG: hypothetical protein QGF67_04290 [Lentisphaeria bacterium]|nr:hypothetical protein [Lentisphaeria bacterium]MDP7740633.1 hypothetical protein [Lentisphaeria bacterium]